MEDMCGIFFIINRTGTSLPHSGTSPPCEWSKSCGPMVPRLRHVPLLALGSLIPGTVTKTINWRKTLTNQMILTVLLIPLCRAGVCVSLPFQSAEEFYRNDYPDEDSDRSSDDGTRVGDAYNYSGKTYTLYWPLPIRRQQMLNPGTIRQSRR